MNIFEKISLLFFISINLISFLLFLIDKRKAVKGSERIPEKNFFYLSLAGGWVLGFLAIYLIRHKNKKRSFLAKYSISIIPTILLVVLILN